MRDSRRERYTESSFAAKFSTSATISAASAPFFSTSRKEKKYHPAHNTNTAIIQAIPITCDRIAPPSLRLF